MTLLPAVLIGMLVAAAPASPPSLPAPAAVPDTLATLDPLGDLRLEIPASSFT